MTDMFELPVHQDSKKIDGEHEKKILEQEQLRLKALEWPLQAGWFEYRVRHLSDSDVELLAEKIARDDPSETRREYIRTGSFSVKKDAIITDYIDPEGSLLGSIERQWFRSECMKDPVNTRFREALCLIESDPDRACALLESYFQESTKKH